VVTGSTMGIGKACAQIFAETGASVVVNDEGNVDLGQAVVAAIEDAGGCASYYPADVRVHEEIRSLIAFTVDTYGRIDILMNNAVADGGGSVETTTEETWDSVFDSSIKAAFLGCKYAIPTMIERGGGAIINTSSVHGMLAAAGGAAYEAAKAALINFTRQLAVDYGRQGIRANALCPGRILTERKIAWLNETPEEARRQRYVYPMGRPGTTREIAKAALFLASDDASFITGHALVVDGGLTAQLQDDVAKRYEHTLQDIGLDLP
jgi:NAD(P)-dependent dehydrogenase (short-subunit alcohol dehydrogenase family)